jgi:3-carboxy-cis,cis-muconate cycloisomerase
VARARQALAGLQVDERRMRGNLEQTGGLILSEQVMMALAVKVGRERAHQLVHRAAAQAAAKGGSLREELLAEPQIVTELSPVEIDAALDPAGYLGSTVAFIDRALAAHQARSRRT